MPELIPVITKAQIDAAVSRIARDISNDYQGRNLVMVGVLKGAFIFMADLARNLSIPVQIDFLRAASYGAHAYSSETIRLTKSLELDVKDKDVLIVEDIVDTGLTLKFLKSHIKSLGAMSVKVCTLVDKRERRKCELEADYVCHAIDKGFLVGYGLDYAEEYRGLPEIYHLKW